MPVQFFAEALPAVAFRHDDVFEVQPLAFPSGVAVIIQRNADELAGRLVFSHQQAEERVVAEAVFEQLLGRVAYFVASFFVNGQFQNQVKHLGYVGAGAGADSGHSMMDNGGPKLVR